MSRVTVAFGRADRDSDLLSTAASVAKDIGASLRVVCFAVRPVTAATGSIEPEVEDLIVREWANQLEADIRPTLGADAGSPDVDFVVGQGGSWAEAITDVSWSDGEVLAVGTSSSAISRFFLGGSRFQDRPYVTCPGVPDAPDGAQPLIACHF